MTDSLPDAIANRVVVLGRVRSAVGLAGWVKVESYTDPPENILRYPVWQLSSGTDEHRTCRAVKCAQHRWSGPELQVRMEGVTERNSADALRNMDIGVLRRELPPPGQGEYYWDDLLGLSAVTLQGKLLGKVDHFQQSPAHPYMVLHAEDDQGRRCEHFVPLVKGRVLGVDFAQGTVQLDWTLDWI
ncbi:MAG TPA: ribosome maturation factor RimM [Steroidobacteraceae bacterium]|nr:ribosome maturation factor RimM [Steroidobacteraceae bacterium]